jgi:hypothetical protein
MRRDHIIGINDGLAADEPLGQSSTRQKRTIVAPTWQHSVAAARRYIRDGSLSRGNAAAAVGCS